MAFPPKPASPKKPAGGTRFGPGPPPLPPLGGPGTAAPPPFAPKKKSGGKKPFGKKRGK